MTNNGCSVCSASAVYYCGAEKCPLPPAPPKIEVPIAVMMPSDIRRSPRAYAAWCAFAGALRDGAPEPAWEFHVDEVDAARWQAVIDAEFELDDTFEGRDAFQAFNPAGDWNKVRPEVKTAWQAVADSICRSK